MPNFALYPSVRNSLGTLLLNAETDRKRKPSYEEIRLYYKEVHHVKYLILEYPDFTKHIDNCMSLALTMSGLVNLDKNISQHLWDMLVDQLQCAQGKLSQSDSNATLEEQDAVDELIDLIESKSRHTRARILDLIKVLHSPRYQVQCESLDQVSTLLLTGAFSGNGVWETLRKIVVELELLM